MKLSDAFYNAVNNRDIIQIRMMMDDSLLIDRTFERFDAMESAAKNIEGLYDKHDGKQFILDKSLWNKDYMSTLMVEVIDNFSHERIAHLKDVVRYLYPIPADSSASKTSSESRSSTGTRSESNSYSGRKSPSGETAYQKQKRLDQENGSYIGIKVATGAVIGGLALGTVAAITGGSVFGWAAAGAAAGAVAEGVFAAASKNGKN